MDDETVNEANRLKRQAGQKLEELLNFKFKELVEQGILKSFGGKRNFCHTGYTYKHQYKTNYILETLDEKLIIINSSNSYRDRVKQDLYDFEGIMKHAEISNNIIASILLYPDEEFVKNSSLRKFRSNAENKIAYCPATHIFGLLELIQFLENHKFEVEQEWEREKEEAELVRDGSYYGKRGNAFEKEVVEILGCYEQLRRLKVDTYSAEPIYAKIISKLVEDYNLCIRDLISVEATDTIKKLANGGNAKTDVIIKITTSTRRSPLVETISIKNTTQNDVACHDYQAGDFIRVLNIHNEKLASYLRLYQKYGSHKKFIDGLPVGYNLEEFEKLLTPYGKNLVEWALTGKHDNHKLIEADTQVSNYLLINKEGNFRFTDFDSYIAELYSKCKLTYGVPLRWTYPSKQRGVRIKLKLPVIL